MKNNAPNIAFLGLSENVSKSMNIVKQFTSLNILNLRSEIFNFIYPMSLSSFKALFAFYNILESQNIEIIGRTEKQRQIFSFKMQMSTITDVHIDEKIDNLELINSTVQENHNWIIQAIPIYQSCIILEPERMDIFACEEDKEYKIGQVFFMYVKTPPLNEERISAIKSNPLASKYVKLQLRCNSCGSELNVIAGITKPKVKPNEIWYKDLEDYYKCRCGEVAFDTKYLKNGISHYLGNPIGTSKPQYSLTRMYEKNTLISILERYWRLIKSNPPEEEIQTFLKNNTIFFHIFSPYRIINKAPILNKHATDFAILSTNGTLFLVEIEKPNKPILKKSGGRTSEFNHPFDQVNDWFHIIKDHRTAVLDMLDISPKYVTSIRGIVIYGTEDGCDTEELRKIKSSDFGQVDFYTFNDIAKNIETLIDNFENL